MRKDILDLRNYIYDRADNYCNQKYGDGLPYSFHLKCVEAQGEKFINLVREGNVFNEKNQFSTTVSYKDIIRAGLSMHEAIEDFRLTYNDIKDKTTEIFGNYLAGETIADIVYCCSDEKGKSRKERKSEKYYQELSENSLAVFVKLADISANTLYSKLTNSSMYQKYKSEFQHFKEICYKEEYKEFFDYLENL